MTRVVGSIRATASQCNEAVQFLGTRTEDAAGVGEA